jgi:hypothetical protein
MGVDFRTIRRSLAGPCQLLAAALTMNAMKGILVSVSGKPSSSEKAPKKTEKLQTKGARPSAEFLGLWLRLEGRAGG